jgi:hypothetical protein
VRINHRIVGRSEEPFWDEIDELGLAYERSASTGLSILNITEDAPDWSYVRRLCEIHRVLSQVSNLFSTQEVESAAWLTMHARGHHGYPMPDDDFSYREATYDVRAYCSRCGIGAIQNAPFRIRGEFRAPRSHFIQLNWIFDEFFVRTPVAAALVDSKIQGVSFLAPMLHKRNEPSRDVVQMKIEFALPPAIHTANLQPVTCVLKNEEWRTETPAMWLPPEDLPYCGRRKYHMAHAGPLRLSRTAFDGAPDVVKTTEWFGSGASACHEVIVSARFRRLVTARAWRGVSFEPVELTDY